jgi:Sulfatase
MNFLVVCLHSLDMRDFHSHLRLTPFLDALRGECVFLPIGRGQSHNQRDSLNAELTGQWTARHCDSQLTSDGYVRPTRYRLPKTVIEYFFEAGYEVFTCLRPGVDRLGTAAVSSGMAQLWLRDQPERLWQFSHPEVMTKQELLRHLQNAKRFFAWVCLRETHRPWTQPEGLGAIVGQPGGQYPHDAYCARRAALEVPEQFAALRRRGLQQADRSVQMLIQGLQNVKDLVLVIYSNHGEVFDHFRYHLPYINDGANMIRGTSHGPFPYEVLYANMQLWRIPDIKPIIMQGISRSIDIAPTLLQIAGISTEHMDGSSMLTDFERGEFPERDRYAESAEGGAISMVRSDGYKILSTGNPPEGQRRGEFYGPDLHRLAVFNLRADPWEYFNLIDSARGQEVLRWAVETHSRLSMISHECSTEGT